MYWISCFLQAAQIFLKMPAPHNRLSGLVLYICCLLCLTFYLVASVSKTRDSQIFQKPRSTLKILGARKMTWNKFHAVDPYILGTAVENILTLLVEQYLSDTCDFCLFLWIWEKCTDVCLNCYQHCPLEASTVGFVFLMHCLVVFSSVYVYLRDTAQLYY